MSSEGLGDSLMAGGGPAGCRGCLGVGGRPEAGGAWLYLSGGGGCGCTGGQPGGHCHYQGPGRPAPGLRLGELCRRGAGCLSAQRLRTGLQEQSLDWNTASREWGCSRIPQEQAPIPHGVACHPIPAGPAAEAGHPPGPNDAILRPPAQWVRGEAVESPPRGPFYAECVPGPTGSQHPATPAPSAASKRP